MANQELSHPADDVPAYDFPPATVLDGKNPTLKGRDSSIPTISAEKEKAHAK